MIEVLTDLKCKIEEARQKSVEDNAAQAKNSKPTSDETDRDSRTKGRETPSDFGIGDE